jgi:hypothetical protein
MQLHLHLSTPEKLISWCAHVLQDGQESCVTITTTLEGYAITNQPDNFTGPMASEHTICWYR